MPSSTSGSTRRRAKVVLRSGIPRIVLSPLNVSRKTALTRAWYEKMVAPETPLTRLLRETVGPRFAQDPARRMLMYDQVAVGSLVDPDPREDGDLYVDVDANRGVDYGVSVGGEEPWPGAEGARKVTVQFDLEWERFIAPLRGQGRAALTGDARPKASAARWW